MTTTSGDAASDKRYYRIGEVANVAAAIDCHSARDVAWMDRVGHAA